MTPEEIAANLDAEDPKQGPSASKPLTPEEIAAQVDAPKVGAAKVLTPEEIAAQLDAPKVLSPEEIAAQVDGAAPTSATKGPNGKFTHAWKAGEQDPNSATHNVVGSAAEALGEAGDGVIRLAGRVLPDAIGGASLRKFADENDENVAGENSDVDHSKTSSKVGHAIGTIAAQTVPWAIGGGLASAGLEALAGTGAVAEGTGLAARAIKGLQGAASVEPEVGETLTLAQRAKRAAALATTTAPLAAAMGAAVPAAASDAERAAAAAAPKQTGALGVLDDVTPSVGDGYLAAAGKGLVGNALFHGAGEALGAGWDAAKGAFSDAAESLAKGAGEAGAEGAEGAAAAADAPAGRAAPGEGEDPAQAAMRIKEFKDTPTGQVWGRLRELDNQITRDSQVPLSFVAGEEGSEFSGTRRDGAYAAKRVEQAQAPLARTMDELRARGVSDKEINEAREAFYHDQIGFLEPHHEDTLAKFDGPEFMSPSEAKAYPPTPPAADGSPTVPPAAAAEHVEAAAAEAPAAATTKGGLLNWMKERLHVGAPQPAYAADREFADAAATITDGTSRKGEEMTGDRFADEVQRRIFDRLSPLDKLGLDTEGSWDVGDSAHLVSQSPVLARRIVDTQLTPILAAAGEHLDGAVVLAKARHLINLYDVRGLDKTEGLGIDFWRRQAATLEQFPQAAKAADDLFAYGRAGLKRKLDAGVISEEQYEKIIAEGDHYIPNLVDWKGEQPVKIPKGEKSLTTDSAKIRKLTEASREGTTSVNPVHQLVLDTFETEKTILEQKFGNALADLAERNEELLKGVVEKVGPKFMGTTEDGRNIFVPPISKDGKIVTYLRDGKRQYLEVLNPDIHGAIMQMQPTEANLFVQLLQRAARATRVLTAVDPGFGLQQGTRVATFGATQLKNSLARVASSGAGGGVLGAAAGAINNPEDRLAGAEKGAIYGAAVGTFGATMGPTVLHMGSALADILGHSDVYDQWLRQGGSGFAKSINSPEEAAAYVKNATQTRAAQVINPKTWVEGLGALTHLLPEAVQLAHYKQAIENGVESARAQRLALAAGGLNHTLKGADTGAIASVSPFFMDKLSGLKNFGQNLLNPNFHLSAAALLTVPTLAYWYANKDNPQYLALKDADRDAAWYIFHDDGTPPRQIKKVFELSAVYSSLPEHFLNWAYGKDERIGHAVGELIKETGATLLPHPALLTPAAELWANKQMSDGSPVVSQTLAKLTPEAQYDKTTSSLAYGLGQASAAVPVVPTVSPKRVDHFIRSVGSSGGNTVNGLLTQAAQAAGLDKRAPNTAATVPILGRFTKSAGATTRAEDQSREVLQEAQKIVATFQRDQKLGRNPVMTDQVRQAFLAAGLLGSAAKAEAKMGAVGRSMGEMAPGALTDQTRASVQASTKAGGRSVAQAAMDAYRNATKDRGTP